AGACILRSAPDTGANRLHHLSLHDALPISLRLLPSALQRVRLRHLLRAAERLGHEVPHLAEVAGAGPGAGEPPAPGGGGEQQARSEEPTSELQSREKLVWRRLREKQQSPPR